jgi:hypothetical protein
LLQKQSDENFKRMKDMLEKNKQNMHTVMEDGLNQLADKLNIAEQGQEQKTSELNAYADKISAHLVMLDANGK